MTKNISILIAENDKNISLMLVDFLKAQGFLVNTENNGEKILKTIKNTEFDLILLSENLLYQSGQQVLEQIKKDHDTSFLPIIMIGAEEDEEFLVSCVNKGADDCIFKPIKINTLLAKIQAILKRSFFRTIKIKLPKEARINDLSQKETEILTHAAMGLNNQEIAEALFISTNTVANHMKNIFKKFKISNRTLAVMIALKYSII